MGDRLAWLAAVNRERELARLEGKPISEAEAERRLRARGVRPETMRPAPPAGAAAALRRKAELERLARGARPWYETATPAQIMAHNLNQLVSGLREGSLDPGELNWPRSLEGRMLSSTGRTAVEVLRIAGKSASAAAPALGGAVSVRERRITRAGETR